MALLDQGGLRFRCSRDDILFSSLLLSLILVVATVILACLWLLEQEDPCILGKVPCRVNHTGEGCLVVTQNKICWFNPCHISKNITSCVDECKENMGCKTHH